MCRRLDHSRCKIFCAFEQFAEAGHDGIRQDAGLENIGEIQRSLSGIIHRIREVVYIAGGIIRGIRKIGDFVGCILGGVDKISCIVPCSPECFTGCGEFCICIRQLLFQLRHFGLGII